jgi:hypothetical protein
MANMSGHGLGLVLGDWGMRLKRFDKTTSVVFVRTKEDRMTLIQ